MSPYVRQAARFLFSVVEAMSEHDHLCSVVLDLPWLDSRLVITLFLVA